MLARTVAEVLAPALARAGFVDLAERSRSYRTPTDLAAVARHVRDCAGAALPQALIAAFEHAADAGRQWLWGMPTEVVFCTFAAMREIATLEGGRLEEPVYRHAAAILEGALAIGNRADGDEPETVARRMDAAKRAAEAV
jgi:hypothetical protein